MDESDLAQLSDAVAVSTAMWGGRQNIMIPVGADHERLVPTLIRRFHVDILLPLFESDGVSAIVAAHEHLRGPHWYSNGDRLFATAANGRPRLTFVDTSAVLIAYADRWQTNRIRALLPTWDEGSPLDALLGVTFGRYMSPGHDFTEMRELLLRMDGADELVLPQEAAATDWGLLDTPLSITTLGLQVSYRRYRSQDGLVYGDPANVRDLAWFWNLRADGADVLFYPNEGGSPWGDWTPRHLERSVDDSWKSNDGKVSRYVSVHVCDGATLDEDPSRDIPELAPLAEEGVGTIRDHVGPNSWHDPTISGYPAFSKTTQVIAVADNDYGSTNLTLQLADHPFGAAAEAIPYGAQWVVMVRSLSGLGSEATLSLPNLPNLNEWYSRQIVPANPWSLRVRDDGFDLIRDMAPGGTLRFSAIRPEDLVSKVLLRSGVSARRSAAGDITLRLIAAIGGGNSTNLFRVAGLRKLLTSSKARTGLAGSFAVQTIKDVGPDENGVKRAGFDRFARYWRGAGGGPITPEEIFDILLERGVFRPGLRLRCPTCRISGFYEVRDLSESVDCSTCAKVFLLGPQLSGAKWQFRLSGVLSRTENVAGSMVSIVATNVLLRHLSGTAFALPEHNLELEGLELETDILCLAEGRSARPAVCIGECKNTDEIMEETLARLLRVREVVRDSGIDCYVLLAVMRLSLTDTELEMCRRAVNALPDEEVLDTAAYVHARAFPLIILTSQELEDDPSLPRIREGLPHQHPFSFQELAENTMAAYLTSQSR